MTIRYRFDVSDRYLIDVDQRVLTIWQLMVVNSRGKIKFAPGQRTLISHCRIFLIFEKLSVRIFELHSHLTGAHSQAVAIPVKYMYKGAIQYVANALNALKNGKNNKTAGGGGGGGAQHNHHT